MQKQENESFGMRLLKRGQKGIVHAIFSRFGLLLLLLLLQIFMLFSFFVKFQQFLLQYAGINALFSIILMLYLINSDINPTAKITWLIICMIAGFAKAEPAELLKDKPESGLFISFIPTSSEG